MRYLVGHANYGRVEPGTDQNPAGRRLNRTKQMLQGFAMQCFKVSLCIFWGLSVLTQPQLNCLTALLLCFDPSELGLCSCRGPLPPPDSAREVGAMRAGSKTGEAQGCKKCSSRTERLGSSLPAITRWFISPTGLISFRPPDIAWIILDQGEHNCNILQRAFFPHRADLHIRPVFSKTTSSRFTVQITVSKGKGNKTGNPPDLRPGHGPTTQHKKRQPPRAKPMQGDGLPGLNAAKLTASARHFVDRQIDKTCNIQSPGHMGLSSSLSLPTLKLLKTSHLHP